MMKIQWKRVFKLTIFSVVSLLTMFDILGAWLYVGSLIYPNCFSPQSFPGDFPAPEPVELKTGDGILIPAWYFPSQNGAMVILLGGVGGSLGPVLPVASLLLDSGYGVLQIGSRACGRPVRPITLGGNEINEAAAGLDYLLIHAEVDPNRIGIYGFSMGGVGAIRTAARYPEISAVIAEGGYFNLGQDIVELESGEPIPRKIFLYTIAGVFWLRTGVNPWRVSPVDEIGTISPRPVLLIYGEHEAESGRARLQFDEAGEPKELWIVPGGDHGQNYLVTPEEYARRIEDFFRETLLSPK
jgi:uncharacterized protein